MSDFDKRENKGKKGVLELKKLLHLNPNVEDCINSGREHLYGKDFCKLIDTCNNDSALYDKHLPDLKMIMKDPENPHNSSIERRNRLINIEVKNSKGIEVKSYIFCIREEFHRSNIWVVFYRNDRFYVTLPLNLEFIKQNRINMPIKNDIWLCPSIFDDDWTKEDYKNWRKSYGSSGRDFAFVDFKNTEWLFYIEKDDYESVNNFYQDKLTRRKQSFFKSKLQLCRYERD